MRSFRLTRPIALPPENIPRSWWLALVVLLGNDHFLKQAELLPGWLTGKLSDVAGLVVGPVLLGLVVHPRSRATRSLCLAVVAVPFVAINLSPRCASWLAEGLTAVGLPSRIWTDPSDLLALLVLPWTWRLLDVSRRGGSADPLPSRLAVVVGGCACMATSYYGDYEGRPAFLNVTARPLRIVLSDVTSGIECDTILAGQAPPTTSPLTFDAPACLTLPPSWAESIESFSSALSRGDDCAVVAVTIEGLPPVGVGWSLPVNDEPYSEYADASKAHPNLLYIHEIAENLILDPGPRLFVWELDEANLPPTYPEADPCPEPAW